MTTPRTRSLVSLAAALALTLTLSGCASAPAASRLASDAPVSPEGPPPVVHFDNDSRDYVQVYLVGLRREWLLGRVAPGARTTLRIPVDALDEDAGEMRLAVISGGSVLQRAAVDAGVTTALPRPTAEIVGQRWTFSQRPTYGELTPLPLAVVRAVVGRP
jgi:hypothetical protein